MRFLMHQLSQITRPELDLNDVAVGREDNPPIEIFGYFGYLAVKQISAFPISAFCFSPKAFAGGKSQIILSTSRGVLVT